MDCEERDFYANSVQVTTSLYDVTLHFRVQTHIFTEPEQQPLVEARKVCSVRMSPQHAKSVAALLIKQIAEYEKVNGLDLPIPPNSIYPYEGIPSRGLERIRERQPSIIRRAKELRAVLGDPIAGLVHVLQDVPVEDGVWDRIAQEPYG